MDSLIVAVLGLAIAAGFIAWVRLVPDSVRQRMLHDDTTWGRMRPPNTVRGLP